MIEGLLQNLSFGDVLQVIALGRKSGVLEVVRTGARARLSFSQGALEYAQLSPGLHLGELLVRMELLTTTEVQELLRAQRGRAGGAALGRLALEAGLVDEADLQAAVRAQVIDAVAELCGWKRGNFRFLGAQPEAPLGEPLDTLAVLMQVVQQLDDYKQGHAQPEAIYLRRGDPTQASVPAGGWEVLGYVDGRRSAASIAAELDLAERQVYRILYQLEQAGIVAPSPYPGELSAVLVLSHDALLSRLIQLSLRRAGLSPLLAVSAEEGLEQLKARHPRAVVVDDEAGEGWAFVRSLRQLGHRSHLPAVVLTEARPPAWRRGWRPRTQVLSKPFAELELQQLVTRMLGRALA